MARLAGLLVLINTILTVSGYILTQTGEFEKKPNDVEDINGVLDYGIDTNGNRDDFNVKLGNKEMIKPITNITEEIKGHNKVNRQKESNSDLTDEVNSKITKAKAKWTAFQENTANKNLKWAEKYNGKWFKLQGDTDPKKVVKKSANIEQEIKEIDDVNLSEDSTNTQDEIPKKSVKKSTSSSLQDDAVNMQDGLPDLEDAKGVGTVDVPQMWVLNLTGDLSDLKLKRATWWQEKAFDDALAATIATSGNRKADEPAHKVTNEDVPTDTETNEDKTPNKVNNEGKSTDKVTGENEPADKLNKQEKSADTVTNEKTDEELKREVKRLVDKFILHASKLPESYLTDSGIEGEPSLTVNFKGAHTSLKVKYGKYQYHFFMSPSPFPAWFHQQRLTVEDQLVPDDVKRELFKLLVHMLTAFLGFRL